MTETTTETTETTEQPVPPKRPLFRPEAVEYHARSQTPNRTLDLHDRRTIWVFRALLLALALAVVFAFSYERPTSIQAGAVVDPDGVTATVTVRDADNVDMTADALLTIDGQPVPGDAPERLGREQVRYRLSGTQRPGAPGVAVISLEPRSIGSLLLGWD